jgi:hypothetical protein
MELIYERVGEQPAAVRALRALHPHSIELAREALPNDPKTFRYNCFQYAFGLQDPPKEVVDICTRYQDVFPSSEFVSFLVSQYLLEISPACAGIGDTVVYFQNDRPNHAAIFVDDSLVSKWGTAHLWRHGIWEVPSHYGQTARTFRPIRKPVAIEAFILFASGQVGAIPKWRGTAIPTTLRSSRTPTDIFKCR